MLGAIIAFVIALIVFYIRFSAYLPATLGGATIGVPPSTTDVGYDPSRFSNANLDVKVHELASLVQRLSANLNDLSRRLYSQLQDNSNSLKVLLLPP